jgi:hypothetical protein
MQGETQAFVPIKLEIVCFSGFAPLYPDWHLSTKV